MHTNRHSPQSEGGAFVGLDWDLGRNPAKQALRQDGLHKKHLAGNPRPSQSFQMNIKYRLGLDLGANSIGWCALRLADDGTPCGLLDMGVRVYPDGRNPK